MPTDRKKRRRGPSAAARFDVLKRSSFACHYCGQRAPNVVLHVDHVTPVAAGGADDPENLVAACSACNLGKGARPTADNPEMRALLVKRWPAYADLAPVMAKVYAKFGLLGDRLTRALFELMRESLERGWEEHEIVDALNANDDLLWFESDVEQVITTKGRIVAGPEAGSYWRPLDLGKLA